MDYRGFVQFAQGHFTDGLVLVVGSGLSSAEGLPGMSALADYLQESAKQLTGDEADQWLDISNHLTAGEGLESALLQCPPKPPLEDWIVNRTCEYLIPEEKAVMEAVLCGKKHLRITTFIKAALNQSTTVTILTPNYDRLIELGCEMADRHVDTTATGHYGGQFDHQRSCMASCQGIVSRGKTTILRHFPRAIVLKPHGSFDWYRTDDGPRRCSLDINGDRLIITPGLNKYRAGYNSPFDKHRELANEHIKKASRLLIVGYGFNDDHLQTHLIDQITKGTPTLILSLFASQTATKLSKQSPNCVSISKPDGDDGIRLTTKESSFTKTGKNLWDIEILTEELLR